MRDDGNPFLTKRGLSMLALFAIFSFAFSFVKAYKAAIARLEGEAL